MKEYESIKKEMKQLLVPTNFSPIANNAVDYAVEMARVIKCALVVFYSDQYAANDLANLKSRLSKNILETPDLKITYASSHKHFSWLQVKDVVEEYHIDMIVMGTMGEGGSLIKSIFGRDTTEIAEFANCPVIAVPAGHRFSSLKIIAYASDLNFIDVEIEKVVCLAKSLNAVLEIFHVSPLFPDTDNLERKNMNLKVDEIKEKYGYTKIHYFIQELKKDEILKSLVSFINDHNTDLMVIFHNHVSAFKEHIFSDNALTELSHIRAPLLVYPED
jgi:hypothetical protein